MGKADQCLSSIHAFLKNQEVKPSDRANPFKAWLCYPQLKNIFGIYNLEYYYNLTFWHLK